MSPLINSVSESPLRLSEAALADCVRRAQAGESGALDELVHLTYRLVRKVAAPLLPAAAVDDAVQETYLLVLRKLPLLQHPEAFRGWLSRIALHVCYDWRRKQKPTEELPRDHAVADCSPQLQAQFDLKVALAKLPSKDRDILILREYLGLSYEELADALTLADGTVRSRLFHARKKLKALLTKG